MNAICDPPKRPFLFTLACFCMHIHEKKTLSTNCVFHMIEYFGCLQTLQIVFVDVLSPPKLRTNLFTTAAVDNIDHNPSSTTATDSFHGTGMSMFQHPTAENEGQSRDVVVIETSNEPARSLTHYKNCTQLYRL